MGTPTCRHVSRAGTGRERFQLRRGMTHALERIVRLGHSSKITARRPSLPRICSSSSVAARLNDHFRGSCRRTWRPDLPEGEAKSEALRGAVRARVYMPTPLVYQGILYVLANNGLLAPTTCNRRGLYRQRLPLIVSGFSASPVAADGNFTFQTKTGHACHRSRADFKHLARIRWVNADGYSCLVGWSDVRLRPRACSPSDESIENLESHAK